MCLQLTAISKQWFFQLLFNAYPILQFKKYIIRFNSKFDSYRFTDAAIGKPLGQSFKLNYSEEL